MPSNRSVGDSHVATLTRRRAALRNSQQMLSLGGDRGAPQAPTRTIPSPPPMPVPSRDAQNLPPPTVTPADAAVNAARASTPAGGDARQAMLEKAKAFLNEQRNPGAQPIPENGIDTQVPGPDNLPLSGQINALGGAGISPEQQFYRLAGRMPSGRELAAMRTTVMLEQQLNRRPTANELRAAIMRPASLSNSFQPIVGE